MLEHPAVEKNNEAAKVSGPGARLKLAREARHITIDEVAKQLRLTPQRVGYIEADDYAAMGAPAFAKGYLRGYAKFLGLSEEETVQTFDELGLESAIQSKKPELIHEKITPAVSVNTHAARRIGYILLLAVVACSAYWWYSHNIANKNSADNKATGTEISQATPDAAIQQSVPLPAVSPSAPVPADSTAATAPADVNSQTSNADNAPVVNDDSVNQDSAPAGKKSRKRAAAYQE